MKRIKRLSQDLLEKSKQYTFKRYFYPLIGSKGVISFVIGARGVGKTIAILQYLASKVKEKKVLYISADHILTQEFSLYDIAESFVNEGGEIIAFDEIHKRHDWEIELKSIFDSFSTLEVLASGSSALKMKKADLSRRHIKLHCQGLSFREFTELQYNIELPLVDLEGLVKNCDDLGNNVIKILGSHKINVHELFEDYLQVGYFPTTSKLNRKIYHQSILESLDKMIKEDIPACYPSLTGLAIKKIAKLLAIVSANVPYVVNLNKLNQVLGVNDIKTLKNYLYHLEEVGAIIAVSKVGEKLSSLKKPEKIFLENTNYMYALTGADSNIGTVRETFVANALGNIGKVFVPEKGDFITESGFSFEVGGRSKHLSQIANVKNSWIISDNLDFPEERKIPIWMFGLLW